MDPSGSSPSERVLILAPIGRDAPMLQASLAAGGFAGDVCSDVDNLIAGMADPAGLAIIAEEALWPDGAERLVTVLGAQPLWSDLPVLLLAQAPLQRRPKSILPRALLERANVTPLSRPLQMPVLQSFVRSSLNARRRQYEMRDLQLELEQAVELGDLFVGILGHDLRTPLTAIALSAERLVHLNAGEQATANRIVRSAARMGRMIEQLLDYVRVRRSGMPLHPTPSNLSEIALAVVREIEVAHPARIVVRQTGDQTGTWDADQLAQLLSNLVTNAVEHGNPGTPVTVELDGLDPHVVRGRVHNAGTVPSEMLPTLFQAFKGVRGGAVTRGGSGLGLGLFIAQEIARTHGGDITVFSDPTVGTRFDFTLPREARIPRPGPVESQASHHARRERRAVGRQMQAPR